MSTLQPSATESSEETDLPSSASRPAPGVTGAMAAVTDNPPGQARASPANMASKGARLMRDGTHAGMRVLAKRPLSALAGAVALGFLVGRLLR